MKKLTQEQKILNSLREGDVTQEMVKAAHGISRLAARIYDLKEQGYDITKRMVIVKNRFGEKCSVAKYTLNEVV